MYKLPNNPNKHNEGDLEAQTRVWISEILGEPLPSVTEKSFVDLFHDGILLCQLINKIKQDTIPRINTNVKLGFHKVENINKFIKGCADLGVPSNLLFTTIDLYEGKDIKRVLTSIAELSNIYARECKDYQGPVIPTGSGASPAVKRKVVIKTTPAIPSPLLSRKITSTIATPSPLRRPINKTEKVNSEPTLLFDKYQGASALRWINTVLEYDEQNVENAFMDDIETSTQSVTQEEFCQQLKDGIKLCKMLNKVSCNPNLIPTINENVGKNQFKSRENIEWYLQGCKSLGLSPANCFATNDLVEEKNLPAVISNIFSLSTFIRKAVQQHKIAWNGALLEPITRISTSVKSISIDERIKADFFPITGETNNLFADGGKVVTLEIQDLISKIESEKDQLVAKSDVTASPVKKSGDFQGRKKLDTENIDIESNVKSESTSIDNKEDHDEVILAADIHYTLPLAPENVVDQKSVVEIREEALDVSADNLSEKDQQLDNIENKSDIIETTKVDDEHESPSQEGSKNEPAPQESLSVEKTDTNLAVTLVQQPDVSVVEVEQSRVDPASAEPAVPSDSEIEPVIESLSLTDLKEEPVLTSKLDEEAVPEVEDMPDLGALPDVEPFPVQTPLPTPVSPSSRKQEANISNNTGFGVGGWLSRVLGVDDSPKTSSPVGSPKTPQRRPSTPTSPSVTRNQTNARSTPTSSPSLSRNASSSSGLEGVKGFFGAFWQETTAALAEIVNQPSPQEVRAAIVEEPEPPVIRQPTIRGKLRGYEAQFERSLGIVRLQAFEMLADEMKERISVEGSTVDYPNLNEILDSSTYEVAESIPTPYLSDRAKQHGTELSALQDKAENIIKELKVKFGSEKTNAMQVIPHTNDSLHLVHDEGQKMLAEAASLCIELLMRIGESWLIESLLSPEEIESEQPENMHKQIHQAMYTRQLLNRIEQKIEILHDTFKNFIFRVGSAGKIRVNQSCSEKDAAAFAPAVDVMTETTAAKLAQDYKSTLTYIKGCTRLLKPLLVYLYHTSADKKL